MTLNYDLIMNRHFDPVVHDFSTRETMLYALGVGCAADPAQLDANQKFLYEGNLVALPTLATVLAQQLFWAAEPETGIDWRHMLHVEQFLTIHRPLPVRGTVVGRTRVLAIHDKGADKGALMEVRNDISDAASGEPLAMSGFNVLLRKNGGFGGSAAGWPEARAMPDSPPEASLALPTRPEQAYIYRLSGDYNPLHVDRETARIAGFERPILHGLCSYGIACRAALALLCDNDPARLKSFDVRFASPVYPGETIRTEIWHLAPGIAALQARVVERDVLVLRNGAITFAVS